MVAGATPLRSQSQLSSGCFRVLSLSASVIPAAFSAGQYQSAGSCQHDPSAAAQRAAASQGSVCDTPAARGSAKSFCPNVIIRVWSPFPPWMEKMYSRVLCSLGFRFTLSSLLKRLLYELQSVSVCDLDWPAEAGGHDRCVFHAPAPPVPTASRVGAVSGQVQAHPHLVTFGRASAVTAAMRKEGGVSLQVAVSLHTPFTLGRVPPVLKLVSRLRPPQAGSQ